MHLVYRMELAYSGSAFSGFARQPGRPTVEAALLEALGALVPAPHIIVAGRTDRGVHAVRQTISFRSPSRLDPGALVEAVDAVAPGALAALAARSVHPKFHAQHNARARRYAYLLPPDADAERLDRLLAPLVGRHDFHAFARDTPRGKTTERRLYAAHALRAHLDDRPIVRIDLLGDGFLRRQIRVTVGAALAALAAGDDDDALARILQGRERRRLDFPADPDGLYFVEAIY